MQGKTTFSQRHNLTLPELPVTEIKGLIELWCIEFEDRGQFK